MIYKPEEQSLLQPLHHYMSCHITGLNLCHYNTCCSADNYSLLTFQAALTPSASLQQPMVSQKGMKPDVPLPRDYQWNLTGRAAHACHSRTIHGYVYHQFSTKSPQLQYEPCFFVGLDNEMNGLFLYTFTAMRNMHLNSRHLQGSRGAGYREIPRKLGSTLAA